MIQITFSIDSHVIGRDLRNANVDEDGHSLLSGVQEGYKYTCSYWVKCTLPVHAAAAKWQQIPAFAVSFLYRLRCISIHVILYS
jgi:hypothetical protein